MFRSLVALLLISALAPVSGCVNKADKAAAPSPLLASYEDSQALDARITWQTDLGLEKRAAIKSITPLGDVIAVLEEGNVVSLIDDDTGNVRWRKKIGRTLERFTTPLIYEEQLIICSESNLYGLRLDNGDLARTFKLQHNGGTNPHILHGFVVLGSPEGIVFAQSMHGGFIVWRYQMSSAIATNPLGQPGSLFVADERGQVATINPNAGEIVWRRGNPPWSSITAQPVGVGGVAYVASHDQKLYAFERASGKILWQYLTEYPLTKDPTLLGDHLYLPTQERGLVCLDTISGRELWRAELTGTPIHKSDAVLLMAKGGNIHRIDDRDGTQLGTIELPAVDMVKLDSEGREIYLINRGGRIMKLNAK
jgi:outer membrane protein assembly factor BamB